MARSTLSPSLLNGKPTTYNFCSTEDIGEHVGDIIYGIFHVLAVYERLALKSGETVGVMKFAERRGKERKGKESRFQNSRVSGSASLPRR